jgi:serine/threonine-protein kinase
LGFFADAIRIEPNYAVAYAGLGDAYQVLAGKGDGIGNDLLERARAAATKATELNPSLGEAHACLGGIYVSDWKWSEAEREFRQAIDLSPSYPTAHFWYGDLLGILGRPGESLAEARRANELDPLSPSASAFLGTALYNARRYDEAIRQLQQTVEAFPRMVVAYIYLGLSYSGKGSYREAIKAAQTAMNLTGGDPDVVGLLGYIQASAGNKSETRRLLDSLNQRSLGSRFVLAGLYMDLGARDKAYDQLERGYAERGHLMELVKITPVFAGLHGDARFRALLTKMKLAD